MSSAASAAVVYSGFKASAARLEGNGCDPGRGGSSIFDEDEMGLT